METKIALVNRYLELVSNFHSEPIDYEWIFHPEMLETEYPNRLSPKIRQRTAQDGLAGIALGKQLLKFQRYEVQQFFESETALTVELIWSGELAIDAGLLKKDQTLKAYVCFVFEFKEGRIFRQRHYDCYEPF